MTSPFFHLLKKDEKFIWDEKYKKALDKNKIFLTNSPILSPYNLKNILLLYVLVALSALRALIAQKDDNNKERAIYYIN